MTTIVDSDACERCNFIGPMKTKEMQAAHEFHRTWHQVATTWRNTMAPVRASRRLYAPMKRWVVSTFSCDIARAVSRVARGLSEQQQLPRTAIGATQHLHRIVNAITFR